MDPWEIKARPETVGEGPATCTGGLASMDMAASCTPVREAAGGGAEEARRDLRKARVWPAWAEVNGESERTKALARRPWIAGGREGKGGTAASVGTLNRRGAASGLRQLRLELATQPATCPHAGNVVKGQIAGGERW